MMKRFACVVLAALLVGLVVARAATVTNQGESITVTLMSETADAGTVEKNPSVEPQAGTDRRGLYVIHYEVPAAGLAAGNHDLTDWDIPKGTILLEDAVIEVQTAIAPATSTNTLTVGGVTILAEGTTLNATGIDAAVSSPGITTADDKPYITVGNATATSGVFTIYLPVILGNAQ